MSESLEQRALRIAEEIYNDTDQSWRKHGFAVEFARRLITEQGEPVAKFTLKDGCLESSTLRSGLTGEFWIYPAYTSPPSDALDAKRLRHFIKGIGAVREMGRQQFTYQPVFPLPDANLMKGSVAEHWLSAIDAAMEKSHE